MNHGDAHEQTDDIGHQPEQPYDGAEAMEGLLLRNRLVIMTAAAHVDQGCPAGVEEHEDDGEQAGDSVDGGRGLASCGARHDGHHGGSGGVASEAGPEQGEVAAIEVAGTALGEDADGVEDECRGDGEAGDHEHG